MLQVKHSLKSTSTWVSVDRTGTVQTAYCNCVAGFGEVCSHVGSVLFALGCWSKIRVGKITASTFKSTTRTPIDNPSMRLIRKNCYPKDHRYSTRDMDVPMRRMH
ncbi:uncharacterized protein LOC129774067 [Toxorhynchites rutilus septentrionalis]|uniref:uncharacterized protein LOC129774067 n=1 Tax=Toxorhynchites rutilus septentrionalis TaxID=329112 RepID=UPI00247858EB|nr:uncharacterized protein LOC129774067 [Toxorhynchites rutilus septentrionalis]